MKSCGLFLVLISLKQVTTQVCNDTRSVIQMVPETYTYTYYEAYEGNDCIFCPCTKSRQATNVGSRLVERLVNVTVSVCCDGYNQDDGYDGDGLKCVPLCKPPCVNGYCRKPNECACEPGYAVDPNDILNRCVPLCLDGCNVPDCLPTCNQNDDYDTISDMCQGSCVNGTCVAPGICYCNSGYRHKSRVYLEDQVCEPVCSSCEHGTCVAPEVCECDSGWRQECGSCQPVCSGCEHGICKAPGQCECEAGYTANNEICEPDCSNCTNGNCIAPNVCACDPGWYMTEGGTECLAHCDVACGNGLCTAPNYCECYPGYQFKALQEEDEVFDDEPSLCVPKCSNCSWICVAPEICECAEDYETIYTTVDGEECDCFNCSSSSQCDQITCRLYSNETEFNYDADKESLNKTSATIEHFPVIYAKLNTTIVRDIYKPMQETPNIKTAKFMYHWIYASVIIVELLVIIILLALMKKKLRIRKFAPQDKRNAEDSVYYNSSVTCSKLKPTPEMES